MARSRNRWSTIRSEAGRRWQVGWKLRWKLSWKPRRKPSARSRFAPFPPAFDRSRRHRPAVELAPESDLRSAPPRACVATSGAAKSDSRERARSSWQALVCCVAAARLVALVELVAPDFALRLGTIISVHERLHPRQHFRRQRRRVDLLAAVEQSRRFVVADRDQDRKCGRMFRIGGGALRSA